MTKANPTIGEIVTVGDSHPVWDAVQAATDRQSKMAASRDALSLVTLPDMSRPVPKLFVDLPWANDREAAQGDILARIIAADDLESATNDDALVKLDDLVGKSVTIWGVVARAGDIEDGWGAYCSLDVTVGDSTEHKVCNTGSREVTVIVWRAHCEKRFPLTGLVTLKGNPTPGRNQPIGFVIEDAF